MKGSYDHPKHLACLNRFWKYHSIQIDYRQTFILRAMNVQLQIQKPTTRRINFHYRDRSVVDFQQKSLSADTDSLLNFRFISITDADFGLETNEFCNRFGYNGNYKYLGGPPPPLLPWSSPEFSRNFPNSPNSPRLHRIPEISAKSGEERNSRNQPCQSMSGQISQTEICPVQNWSLEMP